MVRRFGFIIVIAVIAIGGFVLRDRLSSNPTDLKVGDCFDSPTAIGQTVNDVQHHPCSESHTGEVFAVVTNPAGDKAIYPDENARQTFIVSVCTQPFKDYVGGDIATTSLDVKFFTPTVDGWTNGDRSFTCYVTNTDNSPFTKSIKNSGL